MNPYSWIESFCLSLKGSEMDYKMEWQATRFMIRGKMFAMIGSDKEGRHIISLKLAPENGLVLRSQYEAIRPGYYMNKVHWNSIDLSADVPEALMKEMICESHDIILKAFSKKIQGEIDLEK